MTEATAPTAGLPSLAEAMGWLGFEVDDVEGLGPAAPAASSSTPRTASRPG